MAVDLRIEKFAIDLFRHLWVNCGFEYSILQRPKDYGNIMKSDCTSTMVHAVHCRYLLYMEVLGAPLNRDYDQYSKNGTDFYNYLRKNINYYMPYPNLNVFDKLLMTCAIVTAMSNFCWIKNNIIYHYIIPLCWAMYFESKFKDEFFEAGGWSKLANYSKGYNCKPLELNNIFTVTIDDFDKLYEYANCDYRFEDVIELFKLKSGNIVESPCCVICFPLLNLLYFLSYRKIAKFERLDLLLEGYIQLFIRMMSKDEIKSIESEVYGDGFRNILDPELTPVEERSALMMAVAKVKAITTTTLCQRLFFNENSLSPEELNHDQTVVRCLFCGKDAEMLAMRNNSQSGESDKIEHIKLVITKTVSEEKSTTTKATSIDKSDEMEERMALRLFLTIGIRSAFTKMMANITEEFGFPSNRDVHRVTSSIATLKLQDESTEKASKKKKRKKKEV